MEQPIRSLVAQASVNQLRDKRRQPLPVLFSFRGQRSNHPCQSRRRPAVAAAPILFSVVRFLAVVPDMCQQLFLGIPEPLAEALNLAQGLVIVSRGGKEWRSAVESVRPHLRLLENVVQSPVRRAWRLVQYPLKQPACRFLDFSVAGQLAGAPVGLAAHRRIGGSSLDHHRQSSIGDALHNCGLGEQNDVLVITGLEESLGQDALFPVAALHGQRSRSGLLDSAVGLWRFFTGDRVC
jgi:hypothetical protein